MSYHISLETAILSEMPNPSGSPEYRKARDALREEEKTSVEKVKGVTQKRRQLPPGGRLKEDYNFRWANDGKPGQEAGFSELFRTSLRSCSITSCMAPIGPYMSVVHFADGAI
jgi:predicted dithiol-disulfide oxidoreductase (DUF899 family)